MLRPAFLMRIKIKSDWGSSTATLKSEGGAGRKEIVEAALPTRAWNTASPCPFLLRSTPTPAAGGMKQETCKTPPGPECLVRSTCSTCSPSFVLSVLSAHFQVSPVFGRCRTASATSSPASLREAPAKKMEKRKSSYSSSSKNYWETGFRPQSPTNCYVTLVHGLVLVHPYHRVLVPTCQSCP